MRPLHKKVSCYCGVVEWDALLRGIAFTLFLLIGSLLSITTNFLRVMVVGPGIALLRYTSILIRMRSSLPGCVDIEKLLLRSSIYKLFTGRGT